MIFDTRKNLVDIFKVLLKVVSGCVCYSWIFEGYPGFATSAGQHDALRTANCRHPWHAWVRRNCSGGQHFRIIGMVDICWYPKSSKSWMTMTWYSTSVMVTGDFPWLKNPHIGWVWGKMQSSMSCWSLRAQGLLEDLPFIHGQTSTSSLSTLYPTYLSSLNHEDMLYWMISPSFSTMIPMIFRWKNMKKITVFWVLSVSIHQPPVKCRGLTCLWSRNPWLAVEAGAVALRNHLFLL